MRDDQHRDGRMKSWRDSVVNPNKENFELGPIWSKGDCLQQIAQEILARCLNVDFDYFACIETKGAVFGSAVAAVSGRELRLFRKEGRIAYTGDKFSRTFLNWKQMSEGVEIERFQLSTDDKIVVVDDIVDTGATLENIGSIIAEAGAHVARYICIRNLSEKTHIAGIQIEALLE